MEAVGVLGGSASKSGRNQQPLQLVFYPVIWDQLHHIREHLLYTFVEFMQQNCSRHLKQNKDISNQL